MAQKFVLHHSPLIREPGLGNCTAQGQDVISDRPCDHLRSITDKLVIPSRTLMMNTPISFILSYFRRKEVDLIFRKVRRHRPMPRPRMSRPPPDTKDESAKLRIAAFPHST